LPKSRCVGPEREIGRDDDAQFVDVGPDYYAARTNPQRKVRQHVRELQALGYAVTRNPAA
jgi:hypothetical protein